MKSIAAILVSLQLLSSALTLSAAPVCDGWGGGNCIDPKSGGSSSGGSSYSGPPPVFFDGRRTARAVEMIEECGTNPLCMMLRACLLLPMGLMFDAPVYTVKGVGYGLYYGAIGLGKGAAGIGRGIAYPFKQASASRADKRRKAAAIVGCAQVPAGSSFDSYRGWEQCKKNVLKRQKALTRLDASNKDNELWCKGHIPLSFGPNTNAWLTRCNPGGELLAMPAPAPEPAINTVSTPPSAAPPAAVNAAGALPAAAVPASAVPAPAGSGEAASAGAQAGFDTSGAMAAAPPAAPPAAPAPAALQTSPAQPATAIPAANAPEAAIPAPASAASAPTSAPTADANAAAPRALPQPAAVQAPKAAPQAVPAGQGSIAPSAASAASFAAPAPAAASAKTGMTAKAPEKGLSAAKKVLDCGLKPFLSKLADPAFEAELKKEINGVFGELSKTPVQGRSDVQQVYSISRNSAVKTGAGERQAVLSVGVQRMDLNGELHVDVQFSLGKSGEKSVEGQTIVFVSQSGKMTPVDVRAPASQCLGL